MNELRRPPIGSRPGTLVIDPDAPAPRLSVTVYDADHIDRHEDVDVGRVEQLQTAGRKMWVDVQGLGNEGVLRALGELFSIHPLALEDIAHVPIRPKAEPYVENLLIVTRMLRSATGDSTDVEQVSLIVGRDYVLTFQEQVGDVLDSVRQRLQVQGSLIRSLSTGYLAYAILDTIIDAYYPVIERLGDRLEELEELVLNEASPETLRDLNSVKGDLLGLRRAVVPQRESVNSLIRDEHSLIDQKVRMYLRDTYDHVVQTVEAVETAREQVNGLMNTYLSVVSNRMNEVMKTLTIVASVFVPLTFMAGIYGMNFENMPELHTSWGYPTLLALMALAGAGMLFYFKRKGWIGRS